ncbi:MAG: folate-binding protein YgfZ [Gammaproteobacteria bacterium]|jgi:folate-binding protein YgfZ
MTISASSVEIDSTLCTAHGWVGLNDHCVLSFRGSAVRSFLGRQLTCDINDLSPATPQFGAWLTAKGRVLALLRLFEPAPNHIDAIVPIELASELIKRLRLFVMRDDVAIDIDTQQVVVGLWGDCVAACGGDAVRSANSTTIHLAARPLLAMLCAPTTTLEQMSNEHTQTRGSTEQWQYMCIKAGLPQVELATREAFIPQMINLDRLGGVSFTKGCYPGQEIVARTQHLGRIKRRMFIARALRADAHSQPQAGDVIVGAAGEDIGGRVVSVAHSQDDILLLAVLPINSAPSSKPVHLHHASGTKLEVLTPPYSLSDPVD